MTTRKFDAFQSMHHAEEVLVLPNAWDVATAVLMERAGFPAVATTSAGMAVLYGYPDADAMTCGEVVALARRMTARFRSKRWSRSSERR